ncbi:MAG: hypothetical protein M3142_02075, partial [Bacteroidota bacterium]|nr:hypothetical protein [Bacteroidota bacterium]
MKRAYCLVIKLAFIIAFGFLPGCQSSGNREEKTEITATEKIEVTQPVIQSAIDSAPPIPETVKKTAAVIPAKVPETSAKLAVGEPVKKKTKSLPKKDNPPVKPKKTAPTKVKPPVKRMNLRSEVNFAKGVPQSLRKQVKTDYGLT